MIKTWFKEYEKIKDKAVVVYPYEWDCMSEKQRNKILSKKTVITQFGIFYNNENYYYFY